MSAQPSSTLAASPLGYWGGLVLLFALYLITAKLGLHLGALSGFAALVWPPTGIALAALLLFGPRLWPAITLSAFLTNFTSGAPALVALGIATGNTLEAVAAAYFLMRVARFDPGLSRARDVVALVIAAAFGSTVISAAIGVTSLAAGGVLHGASWLATFRAWWIGDALGDLVLAPFLLVWWKAPELPRRTGLALEGFALIASIVLVSLYVFDVVLPRPNPRDFRWPYLVFSVLVWAALRFRQQGGTSGTLVVWIVAIVATVKGLGPFASGQLTSSLLPLQLFIGVVALTTLSLAAAVTERDLAAQVRDRALEQTAVAERRARFLADASSVVASGLDYEQTMQNLARLVVPRLGDNCVVDIVGPDGAIQRVAEASADPRQEELLRQLRKYPPSPARSGSPVIKALATGGTVFIPEFTSASLAAITPNDEYTTIVRALAPRSSVTVSLKSRDRVLGAITFGMANSGRHYTPDDIVLAEEVAHRAAVGVDNAMLYEQSRQAIQARDVFLGVASHELRTPLTALDLQLGNMRRSLEQNRDGGPEKILARVTGLEQQADRLTGLVEYLLDVTRVASGRLSLSFEELDMCELVREVTARFRDQATLARCDLTLEAPGTCTGHWDRPRTEQVLTNLLENAIKFGIAKPVGVRVDCAATTVTISVRDQGIGIAPEDHEQIFERFRQATPDQLYGGLGLGLWIVRRIVQAMGGGIEVRSEVGKGAEFLVRLPRLLPDEHARTVKAQAAP